MPMVSIKGIDKLDRFIHNYPAGNIFMFSWSFLFSLLFVITTCVSLSGQSPAFNHAFSNKEDYTLRTLTTADGLSHNMINCIVQDKTGFIWVATFDGLCRFDGYEFKKYYHQPGDTTGLPYFETHFLRVDKENNLWIIADGNYLSLYDRASDKFHNYSYKSKRNITSKVFLGIDTDIHGNLWFNGDDGVYWYDYSNKQFVKFPFPNSIRPQLPSGEYICIDNKNKIWLVNTNELTFIGDADSIISNKYSTLSLMKPCTIILNIPNYAPLFPHYLKLYNSGTDLWLATNFGLFKSEKRQRMILQDGDGILHDAFTDSLTITWATLKDGFYIYNTRSHHCINISPGELTSIQYCFLDKNKQIWCCGFDKNKVWGGLSEIIPSQGLFKYFLTETPEKNKLAVFGLFKDSRSNLWIGTKNYSCLIKILPTGQEIQCDFLSKEFKEIGGAPRAFTEDKNGKIWIGYYGGLLNMYDPDNNTFTQDVNVLERTKPLQKHLLSHKLLFLSADHNLYISGDFRFAKMSLKSRLVVFDTTLSGGIYSMIIDKSGSILLGGAGKIFKGLDENNKVKFKEYPINGIYYNIESIIEGGNNILWLGLLGGGIGKFNLQTGGFRIFTTKDGLSNNTVYNLIKDQEGNLWASTNNGISCFNIKNEQIRNFSISDGLKIQEFNSDAACIDNAGDIYLGGMGGVVCFNPKQVLESRAHSNSPVIIEDFTISGTPCYFMKALYDLKVVTLPKGTTNFKLSYSCLDLRYFDKIRYRYKLEGADKEWISSDYRNRFCNYSNLSPQHYRIVIQATDPNGNWNRETSLVIIIPPFYYQTVLFKLLVVLFILLLLSGIILFMVKSIRLSASKKLEQLKLETLRGQLNPHFIFNAMNSINYFISGSDKINANKYIGDFSDLIRAFLTNSSKEYIPFEKELELIEAYLKLEQLRFKEKFVYSIETDENINIPDVLIMPSMIQPFIENAIWHGVGPLQNRTGKIVIRFSELHSTYIKCIIEDDGIGRKASQGLKKELKIIRKSRGIEIITERLQSINSIYKTRHRIVIEDLSPGQKETGTRVIIDIPVKS
jgi:ligand-binding sensor domain-containing protein